MLTDSPTYKVTDGRPYRVSSKKTHFHPDTPASIAKVIDRCISDGTQIRLFYGDVNTGVAWDCENDSHGTLGRSHGPCKIPLIIAPDDDGGPRLLEHCIVGILGPDDTWIYRHPKLALGEWSTRPYQDQDRSKHLNYETLRDGQVYGRHETLELAQRLVAFMTGQRLTPGTT